MSECTYLRDIRMRIKERFNESLSENVIAILIWTMLEQSKSITYESMLEELNKRQNK